MACGVRGYLSWYSRRSGLKGGKEWHPVDNGSQQGFGDYVGTFGDATIAVLSWYADVTQGRRKRPVITHECCLHTSWSRGHKIGGPMISIIGGVSLDEDDR